MIIAPQYVETRHLLKTQKDPTSTSCIRRPVSWLNNRVMSCLSLFYNRRTHFLADLDKTPRRVTWQVLRVILWSCGTPFAKSIYNVYGKLTAIAPHCVAAGPPPLAARLLAASD
ncbi:hypothetical protein SCLCIDRAFT_199218 [Scleroderma citrinum Foug A]|uniref:Uncharacterized protein n=1 Tax=Scleroderma citrinum Foug A TaxID=1036808 RepID=A0A0C2ZWS3_9AGAM|nr:hypothetical protein SCLCIDRAFT_199218 [Scleroderma citrinum Foug A]